MEQERQDTQFEGNEAKNSLPQEADFELAETVEEKYSAAIDLREKQYDQDVERDPKMAAMRASLDVHNGIVLGYANELIAGQNLPPDQKVAATLATVLHDSGKLASPLLEHHKKGTEYAGKILDNLSESGQTFDGVAVTPEIRQKALEAIDRHMNHPFLVMLNKGERMSEPQDDVDRVVFDADMMANIGFKNVGFRLIGEKFMADDAKAAVEKGTTTLQASFENVMQGVRQLDKIVLSDTAKQKTGALVAAAERIFQKLVTDKKFAEVQGQFSGAKGEFNLGTIQEKGGAGIVKKRLNEEIFKTGLDLGINSKLLKNFEM